MGAPVNRQWCSDRTAASRIVKSASKVIMEDSDVRLHRLADTTYRVSGARSILLYYKRRCRPRPRTYLLAMPLSYVCYLDRAGAQERGARDCYDMHMIYSIAYIIAPFLSRIMKSCRESCADSWLQPRLTTGPCKVIWSSSPVYVAILFVPRLSAILLKIIQ